MRPDPEMIPVLIDTAHALKGGQRRVFMAKTVGAMGRGGQRWAQVNLAWCRGDDPHGHARTSLRHDLRRCLPLPPSQARRGAPAPTPR